VKLLHKIWKKRKLFIVDSFFVFVALFYFLFFVNRGFVVGDEGYYVHYAERIAQGQIPYKDFVLQYTPGYFYLLAVLYKVFGAQLLVGRFVSLITCILILIFTLILLRVYKIKSLLFHIVTALVVISLGYPLLHLPLVIWICVLISLLLVFFLIKWKREKQYSTVTVLGILLACVFLTKQNVGAIFILLTNGIIIFNNKKYWKQTSITLLILNSIWLLAGGLLVGVYFLYVGNINGIITMFAMSKQFIDTYPFTYPSLTNILQPTGFFKLLPYYFPLFIFCTFLLAVTRTKVIWEKGIFILFALSGFFVTVYPASDLLHVYPYLGTTVVASLVFYYKKSGFKYILGLSMIFILLGFYLTFFTQSYRYEGYFLKQNSPLHLPKTQGILVDYSNYGIANIPNLYTFIQEHTKRTDYIFVYPFAPLLYFALDRQNPTGIVQFVLLEAPDAVYSEDRVIEEIKGKHVKYIIGAGPYINDKKISKFIQRQKKVYIAGPFVVYEVR
jgi:hypothetical protein